MFDFQRVNKAGARFDWDKLNWLNGQVLHELGAAELNRRLMPLWQDAGFDTGGRSQAWLEQLCELLGPSLTLLADGVEQARPFFETPSLKDDAQQQLQQAGAKEALKALLSSLGDEPLEADQAKALLGEACKDADVKKGVLMKSLRGALMGQLQGPDLMESWRLLNAAGQDRGRISSALS